MNNTSGVTLIPEGPKGCVPALGYTHSGTIRSSSEANQKALLKAETNPSANSLSLSGSRGLSTTSDQTPTENYAKVKADCKEAKFKNQIKLIPGGLKLCMPKTVLFQSQTERESRNY